ncbi:MAG: ArsB/NhaD family transporter [Methanomassiliicoccales archaeon]|nr:MAG: ArsB/NhaD family transporter [Methanomassiliicoccales archaeon]
MVFTFALIITEYLHSTVAALVGAALTIIAMKAFDLGFLTLYNGGEYGAITLGTIIETIGLLMGMMIIVGILSKTGFFQWTALKSYEIAKGDPWKLMMMLIIFTAFLSAFLDNVTTVLLMVPVTIELALVLKINPVPMLISEALASNIGGTATVIGDPPNILIGSAFQLTFVDFIVNIGPIIVLNMIVFIFLIKIFFKGKLGEAKSLEEMEDLHEKYAISDMKLFKRSIFIFGIVIVLFVIHDYIGITLAESALMGAVLLLLLSGVDIHEALESVEWSTLLFFAALFVIIAGAIEMGLIGVFADGTMNLIGGNLVLAIVLIIWIAAFTSSIIGAIPSTATMIPIVSALALSLGDLESIGGVTTLYWALSLGACLGGNGTPIGTAASLVVVGYSERTEHVITFREFLKISLPVTVITVLISTIYLLVRYVVF